MVAAVHPRALCIAVPQLPQRGRRLASLANNLVADARVGRLRHQRVRELCVAVGGEGCRLESPADDPGRRVVVVLGDVCNEVLHDLLLDRRAGRGIDGEREHLRRLAAVRVVAGLCVVPRLVPLRQHFRVHLAVLCRVFRLPERRRHLRDVSNITNEAEASRCLGVELGLGDEGRVVGAVGLQRRWPLRKTACKVSNRESITILPRTPSRQARRRCS